MKKVGAREFKNRMGRYLTMIRGGESLEITDRGKPLARLVPAAQPAAPNGLQDFLKALEATGKVRLGKGRLKPFRPVKAKGKSASRMIIEDRR